MFEQLVDAVRGVLTDPAGLDDAALVEFAADAHRLEAVVAERTLAAAAELFARRRGAHDEPLSSWAPDPFDQAEVEVAAALGISRGRAGGLVSLGHALATRLPATRAALAAGLIDPHKARLIESTTANVAADLIGVVEEAAVLAAAGSPGHPPVTGARLRARIDAVIGRVDPDGLRERHRRAKRQRHVTVRPGLDGMSEVEASVPAADGVTLTRRLDELADTVCAADPRGHAARRADALIALCTGHTSLQCGCGNPDCGRAVPDADRPTPRKPLVHVIATADTLDGGDEPGFIDGHGIVDADTVRDLAATGTLRPLDLTDLARDDPTDDVTNEPEPEPGRADPTSATDDPALRYRPGAGLADALRALHGWCQWPHCDRPAWSSDLDHTDPFDHADPDRGGPTNGTNLGPYCRFHHLVKTFGGWRDRRTPGGGIMLISPTGHCYRTQPGGGVPLLTDASIPPPAEPKPPPPPKKQPRIVQRAKRTRAERRRQRRQRHEASIDPSSGDPPGSGDPPPF